MPNPGVVSESIGNSRRTGSLAGPTRRLAPARPTTGPRRAIPPPQPTPPLRRTTPPTPPRVASGAGGGCPERPTRIAGSSAAHGPLRARFAAPTRRRPPSDPPIRTDPVDPAPPVGSATRRPRTCRFPGAPTRAKDSSQLIPISPRRPCRGQSWVPQWAMDTEFRTRLRWCPAAAPAYRRSRGR